MPDTMDAMPPHDLDRLLADTAFVRRLARSLVRDPDAADDLAQDALVVALERPPRTGASPRGWIATVVRRLAIDRARAGESRARRESSASRPEHAPAADEIAARLDASQRVAAALRELEEPYRTALYLRYVEDLEPAQIAARLGVPLATVKTRLRRGLEILRGRFDREWGGRGAWTAALIPWTTPTAHAAPIVGGLIVSTTTKIAAALLVCGVAAWWLWPDARDASAARGPDAPAAAEVALADPDAASRTTSGSSRATAASPGVAAAGVAVAQDGPSVRVLDERRFPAAGAHVLLHVPGFGDDEATTDETGRARFVRLANLEAEKRTGTLLAWRDDGSTAARACTVKAIDASMSATAVETARDLGELVLGAGGSLAVSVESEGRPAPGARVLLEIGARRQVSLEAVADGEGRARFEHLPARPTLVRATSGSTEGRVAAVVGRARATDVVVALQPARTVEVRIVDAETKKPIPGVRVEVSEQVQVTAEADDIDSAMGAGQSFVMMHAVAMEIAPTDERGVTRIAGLPRQGTFEVGARADGWTGHEPPASGPRIPSDSDSMKIELTSLHARYARWPLQPGEVAPPPDGTELRLRKETVARYAVERYSPAPTRAWIERGEIRATGVLDKMYGCYAIAPDGSLARLWIEDAEEVGHTTSFRRPRRVDVRVLDTAGLPARGVPLEIRNEGNNLLLPATETDADGSAAFEGLWGRRAKVFARGAEIGVVDLELGDGRVEGRLPSARELAVQLTVDGAPGLPSVYRIHAGRGTRTLSEDPATGIVRIASETSGEVGLSVTAAGFQKAAVHSVSDTAELVRVDLLRAGALLAHVEPPRSGRVRVRAEPWDAETQRWKTTTAHGVHDERFAPNAPDGAYLFENLAPGTWRVRDVDSEVASDTVDVVAGAAPSEVALDLSGVVRVKGVIEVPAGVSVRTARVVVDGESLAAHAPARLEAWQSPEGHYADGEGRFQLSVDASKPVTLRAVHPWLAPHPERGSVVVKGPTDDVRLVLVEGDEVHIPIAPFGERAAHERLRVLAYAGEPVGAPAKDFLAPLVDGVARFRGLERGTWTLWIDPDRTYAPTVVRGVQVGAGVTRVDAQPTAGCALRVRVLHAAGGTVPRIYVGARRDAEPALVRSVNSRGEEVVVLTGLDAGKYAVTYGTMDGRFVERTIEVDGRTDVDLEYDAR